MAQNNPLNVPIPALLKLSRLLHGVSSLEALVDRVRTVVTEQTRYNRAYIHLIHPDQSTFDVVGWVLPNEEMVRQRLATIDVAQDKLLQRVLVAREPFVVPDLRLDPDADQSQVEFFGNRTSIVLPMFENDERIGPLVIPTYADQGVILPTPEEYAFLIHVAALVGVVIGRLRAEEARSLAEQKLAHTQRMEALGRMAGEVAHDFNNLLLTILANVELAMTELGAHPTVSCLQDVEAAAQRAARLTKQLLATSRGQVLSRDAVSVPALLGNVRKLVETVLPSRVTVELRLPSERVMVMGDVDQLERAVMNLVLNARDAIPGHGRIEIELQTVHVNGEYVAARSEVRSGDYALITVSDTGEGMTREVQARIFEPFFTTKPADRGTGLGLAVVLGVVEQHGGHVHVYSELGLGTTFKIYLPLSLATSQDAAPLNPTFIPPSGQESVLVVDDDEHVRRTIERILLREGYRVTTVASTTEALSWLERKSYKLLLTDLVLPERDGVVLATEAQALHPDLRVLFMTGYSRGKLSTQSLPHLTKPFSATDLLELIRALLLGPIIRISDKTPSPVD